MDPLLEPLNPVQREAVLHGAGPALVLAGAGSGKTRVLTHRIAYLVRERRVSPSRIVAVTFTNKAAKEMSSRIDELLPGARPAWIGTFHGLCVKLLRRDGERVGLKSGFAIWDTADQMALIRQIIKEETSADDLTSARPILSRISRAKNALETPEDMAARAFRPEEALTARVWHRYDAGLAAANAADFDDLLLRSLALLREHADVGGRYAEGCEHLLVDEFQDTNRPQYLLVRSLAAVHGNVFAVGDDDQSIYRFRGAEIKNILDFERDFGGARVLKLEQNYRSTGTILAAAGGVIAQNRGRKGKTLWTENERGGKVQRLRAPDDRAEAMWVTQRVRELARDMPYDEIAVLYRTNAQSRQFEEIFRRDRVPHQVVGSVQFYERKEIRDLLGYLKLIANAADAVSFRRVVNTPARGIGDGTLRVIEETAAARAIDLASAGKAAVDEALVPGRQARELRAFLDLIDRLREQAATKTVAELLDELVERTSYAAFLEKTYAGQSGDRMENVRAFISAATEYQAEAEAPSLLDFLDRLALVSDADEVGREPGVTLTTIHCAKGLEFRAVFLVGLEENLFPHSRSTNSNEDLEEERRLCYVAMTRAREHLALTHAQYRLIQGVRTAAEPSRFLDEVPPELLEEVRPAQPELLAERGFWRNSGDFRGSSAARATARVQREERLSFGPSKALPDPGDGFAVGAAVVHPKFGSGKIMDREGSGKTLKLTIRFAGHGSKKILPAYTELSVGSPEAVKE